ncbi:hypothetical protein YC2023_099739 [Brassica napus]
MACPGTRLQKNSLTTKPYHLQMQRHHRNKEVTVDDNGTAPRRQTDEPEPVEAAATKHRKQPPLLTHLKIRGTTLLQ